MMYKRNILFYFLILISLSSCSYYNAYQKKNTLKEGYIYIYAQKSKAYSLAQIPDSLFRDAAQFRKSLELLSDSSEWKPGKYKVDVGMTDRELINRIKSGQKEVVTITLTYARSPEVLAGRISRKIEADSTSISLRMKDEAMLKELGVDSANIFSIFIPNTYEFYWDSSAEDLLRRMKKERDKFWNESRLEKAEKVGLSPREVYILASIVQSEQNKLAREWPVIAGLYFNRLRIGMPLQSDPTVLFAKQDFKANRVYFSDLEVESPYNTYKYKGLPPGPICMVQSAVLDSVLNYTPNAYLYMCASDKLDGTHSFAVNGAQHSRNAAAYHRALNRAGIR